MSKKVQSDFKPLSIPLGFKKDPGGFTRSLTVSTTIKGNVCEEFEKMVEENNLTRSLLLRQMIYHCLGEKDLLDELKRQTILWGTENVRGK